MNRLNLYNFRQQQRIFARTRYLVFMVMGILAAIIFNLFTYLYFKFEINEYDKRNHFMQEQLDNLNHRLVTISEYNKKLDAVRQDIDQFNDIQTTRDNMVAFFQVINSITPIQIYFTQIIVDEAGANLSGIAQTPLSLSTLINSLNTTKGFANIQLKSDDIDKDENHTFAISLKFSEDLVAKLHGKQ